MSITKLEQETIINFNEEESTATIYTCRPALMRRMESLGVKPIKTERHSCTYEIPKTWFRDSRIGPPAKRALTEEQREQLRLRMANISKSVSN